MSRVTRPHLLGTYRMMPDRYTMSLFAPGNRDNWTGPHSVTDVEVRRLTRKEIQTTEIGLTSKSRVFIFQVAKLNGLDPQENWIIRDEQGDGWVVMQTDLELADTVYRVVCNPCKLPDGTLNLGTSRES